ncbi:metallophosphoesterase family protein [Mesorhizobium sp. VNQ89]|uniref:metallophosphoesterase family protein n=1 Tax=Mesorhizobium quangtriensis TaxID=3157709 RepID=UPI0032B72EBA
MVKQKPDWLGGGMLSLRAMLGIGSAHSSALGGDVIENVRPRLTMEGQAVLYAIGDVHGALDQLRALERNILLDASSIQGRKVLVMLGDYIDRGPRSAQVIDHLLRAPPKGFERICLAGNHEDAMLAFMEDPDPKSAWLNIGGRETLLSYGIDIDRDAALHRKRALSLAVKSSVPDTHLQFLRSLPVVLRAPGLVFSHAGIRPGIPMENQEDHDLLWGGAGTMLAKERNEFVVIHGHRIVEEIDFTGPAISVDTGAYATGRLTALRIEDGCPVKVVASTSAIDLEASTHEHH